jgi:hypothetical protein
MFSQIRAFHAGPRRANNLAAASVTLQYAAKVHRAPQAGEQ